MIQLRKIAIVTILVLSPLAIISCTATSTSESAGQYIDNSAITTKVKTQLFNNLGTRGFDIKVKSYKNNVQLSGFVDSVRLKNRAEHITQAVYGVNRVTNNIIVK